MALSAGSRLGRYEILAAIGAGGMGEVYRARDSRLNRTVAVKVLSTELASDPKFRQRFEHEARAVSALEHPHICALYDVADHDGITFIVMQHLEGETLEHRLKNGPIPLDQSLRYAAEIADALNAAHRASIVHRDLKPGNIMVTTGGAKLLDFGLAKASSRAAVEVGASRAPTTPPNLTAEGTILGTFQYMAPEQLEGLEADARSDVFAFGAVVYEMVTGRKAFEGRSQASLIAAILDGQPPPMTTLRPVTPPVLEHVVATCLAKNPDERWQSMADVARELRWIATTGAAASSIPQTAINRRRAVAIGASAGFVAGGLLIAGVLRSRTEPAERNVQVTRTLLPAAPAGIPWTSSPDALAISPDGSRIAYVVGSGSESQIYLQRLDEFDARPVAGTEQGFGPFFSPDSSWLGFSKRGTLMKVAVSGGAPQTICDLDAGWGATWGPDDTIVFAPNFQSGLFTCSPASGARAVALTTPDPATREKSHRWPSFLPGSRAVLFTVIPRDIRSFSDARIAAVTLDNRQIRTVLEGGTNPHLDRTGHLLYVRDKTLVAVPFDSRALAVNGQSHVILDGLGLAPDAGAAHISISDTGSLIYPRAEFRDDRRRRVVWVSREGRTMPLTQNRDWFGIVRLSPDAQRLAVEISGANDQAWIYDLRRETLTPLTTEWDNHVDSWTPDGKHVVFRSVRNGDWNFYSISADGSGVVERLTESANPQGGGSWSPDGRLFVFHERSGLSGANNLWLLSRTEQGNTLRPLVERSVSESEPAISPDGRWLAYVSNEGGRPEVFVRSFPRLDAKWQISADGGQEPVWEPHGRELFYRRGRRVMAVSVSVQPGFSPGRPRQLFEGDYFDALWHNYDVMPDGRFIMIEQPHTSSPVSIALVQNWLEELKQRVSTH